MLAGTLAWNVGERRPSAILPKFQYALIGYSTGISL